MFHASLDRLHWVMMLKLLSDIKDLVCTQSKLNDSSFYSNLVTKTTLMSKMIGILVTGKFWKLDGQFGTGIQNRSKKFTFRINFNECMEKFNLSCFFAFLVTGMFFKSYLNLNICIVLL